jgi:hypothetical protein
MKEQKEKSSVRGFWAKAAKVITVIFIPGNDSGDGNLLSLRKGIETVDVERGF